MDLRYTTAPKYAYLQPWKNSQCKSWLDIVLVVLYQACWYATLAYYGTEVRRQGYTSSFLSLESGSESP